MCTVKGSPSHSPKERHRELEKPRWSQTLRGRGKEMARRQLGGSRDGATIESIARILAEQDKPLPVKKTSGSAR